MKVLGDATEQMTESIFGVRLARGATDRIVTGRFNADDVRHHAIVGEHPFLSATGSLEWMGIAHVPDGGEGRLAHMSDHQI